MVNSNSLETLRDLHLPTPISVWPPGPAYYLLIALGIIFLLAVIQRKKYLQSTAPKREALAELQRIQANYQQENTPSKTAAAITNLLKRVALVYHPRTDVAQLHGQAWLLFLQKTSKHIAFEPIQTSLLETPFNPNANADLTPLFSAAEHWIKQRRMQCSN
jgi:hypothetical protein